MTPPCRVDETPEVPAQIFESFLQDLAGAGASADLVARLRKTLLVEQTFTERALTIAVLGEEAQS